MNETKLTQTDLRNIELRVRQRMAHLGTRPTSDNLQLSRSEHLTGNIRAIGDIVTLLIAEAIQSGATLIIGILFAILEYSRVHSGAQALGQASQDAKLIAVAVVVANVVFPIYALREMRGRKTALVRHNTLRNYVAIFWHRITGQAANKKVSWSHNPTLHFAAMVITVTTIFLAVFDLLEPLLRQLFDSNVALVDPPVITGIFLAIGMGLSLGGVFTLQSMSHEIGVRTIGSNVQSAPDRLQQRQRTWDKRLERLRAEATSDFMRGKVADSDRLADRRHRLEEVASGESPFRMNGKHQA